MGKFVLYAFMLLWLASCKSKAIEKPVTTLSRDELVRAIVEMYTVNAALNINDISYRDSTYEVYLQQVSKILDKPADVIREDFRILVNHPDTLMALQSAALDTLREMQFHMPAKDKIHIGIN